LLNLSGLESINSVGRLAIGSNDKLANLSGLDNLSSVSGDVSIGGFSMDAIPFAEIHCSGNPSLLDISALSNLISVESLSIHCNDSLSDLSGLENLDTIYRSLYIGFAWENDFEFGTAGNPLLTSLSGLHGLISIGEEVSIQGNVSLEDLTGLNKINEALINSLTIRFNHSLSTCEASGICDYLALPDATIEIHENAPGCNSPEEVEAACDQLSVGEFRIKGKFTIHPNPTSGEVRLQFDIYDPGLTILDLFMISGRRTKSIMNKVMKPGTYELDIDLSDLSPGIYFCTLKTHNAIYTRKIMKY